MSRKPISAPTYGREPEASDWYPQRASRGSRVQRLWHAARCWLDLPCQRAIPAFLSGAPAQAALLSIVPGLGHHVLGSSRAKALGFFAAVSGLLVWTLVFPDHSMGGWVMTAVFCLHNWAMMDCYSMGRAMQREPPLGRGKTVAASLLFGLVLLATYSACESSLGRIGQQTLVSRKGLEPVLNKGDRLLVRRQSEYRRGDIVVSGFHGIERVLALPGEEVRITRGVLLVQGQSLPAEFQPLSRSVLEKGDLEGASGRVPQGAYLVLFPARTSVYRGMVVYGDELLRMFMLPAGELNGRVAYRWYPQPGRVR